MLGWLFVVAQVGVLLVIRWWRTPFFALLLLVSAAQSLSAVLAHPYNYTWWLRTWKPAEWAHVAAAVAACIEAAWLHATIDRIERRWLMMGVVPLAAVCFRLAWTSGRAPFESFLRLRVAVWAGCVFLLIAALVWVGFRAKSAAHSLLLLSWMSVHLIVAASPTGSDTVWFNRRWIYRVATIILCAMWSHRAFASGPRTSEDPPLRA